MKKKQTPIDKIRKMEFPKTIDYTDNELLKKIAVIGYLSEEGGKWYEEENGFEILKSTDNTIVGVS